MRAEAADNDCLPIAALPGTTALFRDYADAASSPHASQLRRWYPADPFSLTWANHSPILDAPHRHRIADILTQQSQTFGAGTQTIANIELLREGAAAVVTGQQVGLFGGPLLTLLKAATAIRKAQDATAASGRPHVPIFWLASEDHDLAEVDQITLLTKTEVATHTAGLHSALPVPVGSLPTGPTIEPALAWAEDLLAYAPICEVLRDAYTAPGATLASGFAKLLTHIFRDHGLIVMDAAARDLHALGAPALRQAIEQADALEAALLSRSHELEAAGYHAQVLVTPGHSLLFLIDDTGARLPLRRSSDDWKAGTRTYTTPELLTLLDTAPERLSPNALLRPIFQDTILPTAAYIGGPAEIAYFAQSAVLYEAIPTHGKARITPVLPRLSATLIEPALATVMASHELSLPQLFEARTADTLALRLGARAMPIEGKRKLAAVGNALDTELSALTGYMETLSPDLGRAAGVSASKMRYQMNRLRRLAATFEVQKQASLQKHANALMLNLYPNHHLQERLLAGIWFLARYGDTLPTLLVEQASQECPGHRVIYL
jgi:bacillithiol biosynthesis cysteine-adding enzyme BshC